MKLSQRLLFGFLAIISVLTTLVVVSVDRRVRDRMRDQTAHELVRDALLIAEMWDTVENADSLADAVGAALAKRVTLVRPDGSVAGDSEFDDPALSRLENHLTRPELVVAQRADTGTAVRRSPSTGDETIYAAYRSKKGFARVALTTEAHNRAVRRVQADVLSAAAIAGLVALLLSILFARSVSQPIVELTTDAREIAAGDLNRRPSISAPGEVGDLATAFHSLAEQLSLRVRALEADDALLRALTESLNEGVVAVDARQNVVHMNGGARTLLNVQDTIPFSADRLPRDRVLRDCLNAALSGAPVDALESVIGDRHITLTARPLAGGGAVLALFDITQIRRLEKVRRDFVANVSHELRTPLTVVGGFAETLADPDVSDAQRAQFTASILSNTRRMQRIVDDLLDLSRIESGGWQPQPTSVNLSALAADVAAAAREVAAQKALTLSVRISDDAATVTADAVALRQILTNLVDNALRHTQSGAVTIFAEREHAGTTVGVQDTGVGIAPEHLSRVFERFYRVDASRSRQEGGTGLGLAIVKHMAEAHGGRAWAESQIGVGTTVRVWLPNVSAHPAS